MWPSQLVGIVTCSAFKTHIHVGCGHGAMEKFSCTALQNTAKSSGCSWGRSAASAGCWQVEELVVWVGSLFYTHQHSKRQTKALGNPNGLCSSGNCLWGSATSGDPPGQTQAKMVKLVSLGVGVKLNSVSLSSDTWRRQMWDCQRYVSHSNLQEGKGELKEG